MESKTLHLYAQPFEHAEAYVVGDASALRSLRDAIDKALAKGHAGTGEVYTQDGEGYRVLVVLSEQPELMLPYAEMPDHRKGKHPNELLNPESYRRMMRE